MGCSVGTLLDGHRWARMVKMDICITAIFKVQMGLDGCGWCRLDRW